MNGLETEPYEFALWRKITAPFAILVMLLLSVPFIFSPMRSTGAGQRILIGIIVGVVYFLVTHVTVRMGEVYNLDPMLSNFAPVLFFVTAGLIGIRMVR